MQRKLLIEGGGDTPYAAAIRFHEWAGDSAKVLLITWASERSNEELVKEFLDWGNNIFTIDQLLVSISKEELENIPEYIESFYKALESRYLVNFSN